METIIVFYDGTGFLDLGQPPPNSRYSPDSSIMVLDWVIGGQ